MNAFPAHIRAGAQPSGSSDEVQTVDVHCRAAAEYASDVLSSVGLCKTAYLAGLLHDCGKFTQAFSDYIWAAYRGEPVRRGSVNHTFAGVQYLMHHYHVGSTTPPQKLTCELIAYAVGAHHGLFDLMKDKHPYGFPHRMDAQNVGCDEAIHNFLRLCAAEEELDKLFQSATDEVTAIFRDIYRSTSSDGASRDKHRCFYLALLSRLLLSSVIEGDRRDTAEFEHRFVFPHPYQDSRALWRECLAFMEDKLGAFEHRTAIQQARAKISDLCRAKAELPGGIYRLNVPTGGGKTLTSLRYALAHAAAHEKQRIFFVIPLLSIIDQNSKVIRDYLPHQDMILEHHSNVIHTEEAGESLDPRELLAESWGAPLVITTLVQLLNTLFSGKTTAIRRFQALCNSVIILDEVQTVPPNMLSLFNLSANFLSRFCGTTIILCSATQPCLEQAKHPLFPEPEDLVPYDPALWAPFRRTHIQEAPPCLLAELPDLIRDKLLRHRSLLVVCNKKEEAAFLYRALSPELPHSFHLSASMCMAHRRSTLEQLTATLENHAVTEGILCISTQVIEAGVDISFDCVVRLLAGMDSAVQAAGRCNRNGGSASPAPVYLLRCSDEKLSMLQDMQDAQNASAALLSEFRQAPEHYGKDLTSDASIGSYYQFLYRSMYQERGEQAQDMPLSKGRDSILNMLSDNPAETQLLHSPQFFLNQSFQTAGRSFHVFDDDTTDVLVPYGPEGLSLISALCSARAVHDFQYVKDTLEKAKPYTVSLFQYQFKKLAEAHALYPTAGQQAVALNNSYYDPSIGLSMEPWTAQAMEVNPCNIPIL